MKGEICYNFDLYRIVFIGRILNLIYLIMSLILGKYKNKRKLGKGAYG